MLTLPARLRADTARFDELAGALIAAGSPIDPKQVAKRSSSERRFPLQVDTSPQRVRFARPDILFYDVHRIDLYQLICALYLLA